MASGHYRLETKIIGRRVKGVDKSVSMVAKAAYRSGQSLHDERADKTFNYRPRAQEVVYSEIMSPQNAPGWLKEPSPDTQAGTRKQRDVREQLWNTVEVVEKRKRFAACPRIYRLATAWPEPRATNRTGAGLVRVRVYQQRAGG